MLLAMAAVTRVCIPIAGVGQQRSFLLFSSLMKNQEGYQRAQEGVKNSSAHPNSRHWD